MKKIFILLTVLLITSCEENLEDLNQNIKDPSSVPGETLVTSAQKNLVNLMVTPSVNSNNTKLWSQYLQQTTYTDESNYDQVTRTIPASHWSTLYKDVLKDLDEASKTIKATTYSLQEEADKTTNKLQVIELLSIYAYSILVETFGDIPYTEAIDINNLSPKYDDGETVYKDLINRLTVVINTLDVSKGSFGTADNIYAGDVTLWKKFAASLKLRMGILLADKDNAFAKTTVEDAVTSGVFTSNADNANFTYLSAAPNTNPVHSSFILSGRQDFVAASTIIDKMNALKDPRRPLYFKVVPESNAYVGGTIGSTSGFTSNSNVSDQVEAATAPGVILDYAEVSFLLAEAAARSFEVGGTAKSFYDVGIMSSIEKWGGSSADASTYLAQSTVAYDMALAASSATIPWKEVIGTQKWIALFNRGFEAYTSIRLLDFPVLSTPAEAVSGFPNRYTYPITEQTLNGSNWSAATTAIGGDVPETKLFWDIN